MFRDLGS